MQPITVAINLTICDGFSVRFDVFVIIDHINRSCHAISDCVRQQYNVTIADALHNADCVY